MPIKIKKIKKSNDLNIGVVGYSAAKFDKQEADKMLKDAFDKIDEKYPDKTKIVVSGLTDIGIPSLAYREAVKRKWKTVGIACSKADEDELFPVDKKIIVGNEWGDESPVFLKSIDIMVKIGGGKQSIKECKEFKESGKEVINYFLPKL